VRDMPPDLSVEDFVTLAEADIRASRVFSAEPPDQEAKL